MRRAFKEFIQLGPGVSQLEGGTQFRPGHTEPAPTRRKFKELIQVGGSDVDHCNQWVTHRYYAANGTELWRGDHGSDVVAVAVDSAGNLFTAGGIRVGGSVAHQGGNKLAKWSPSGRRLWSVAVDPAKSTHVVPPFGVIVFDGDVGLDVACDSQGNAWLVTTGNRLEKYSPSGELLLARAYDDALIPLPITTTERGAAISYVLVTNNDLVVFGTNTTLLSSPPGTATADMLFIGGKTCDLAGNLVGSFYNYSFNDFPHQDPSHIYSSVAQVRSSKYDFDADGNFYVANWYLSANAFDTDEWFGVSDPAIYNSVVAWSATAFNPGTTIHAPAGSVQQHIHRSDFRTGYNGPGAIAVHRPSGEVLLSWGTFATALPNTGQLKNAGATGATSFLDAVAPLVTEPELGRFGCLSINDNKRYIYSVPDNGGITHRVRDYPSKYVCQGDHKGDVYDAIIQPDNSFFIGGQRIFDDCVPAQCTTRYFAEDGTQLWTRNHTRQIRDVCIDSAGNIYECGDADATGVTLRKRSPLGDELWTKKHGATLTVCAITPSGGVVTGGAAGTDDYRLRQYAADGTLDWSMTLPYDVNSLDVDRDGTVIVSCLSHPGLSASPTLSIVSFLDTAGAILSQGDYSYNDPTSPVEIRAIVAVAFSENVLYPYTVSPTLRWLSAVQRVRTGSNSWWVVSLNGNTEISFADGAQPTNGTIQNLVQKKCTGTYARLATTAGAGDTIADVIYGVLGGNPNTDQEIHGGLVHAIQRNGRVLAATSTVQAFDPQTPVHGVFLTDPWLTKPWKTTSTWIADHHGAILGVAVNDAGNSVIGGVVANV